MATWWRLDKLTRTITPTKTISNSNERDWFLRSFDEAKEAAIDIV